MKIVDPGFKIIDIPDGEAALAKIEYLGRIAYKSEDKIDDGRESCKYCPWDKNEPCTQCNDTGYEQVREPSSHKFVRMILKAEQKAKMVLMVEKLIDEDLMSEDEGLNPVLPGYSEHRQLLSNELVSKVYDYMKENPPHESVIEHCSATVVFTVDRGISHELVRHRLAAYTQSSTRYCNYSHNKFGNEITVIKPTFWTDTSEVTQEWNRAMCNAENHYMALLKAGAKPQEARSVLPNSLMTEVAMTANFREFRHVFRLRTSKQAHPQMREVMLSLLEEMRNRIPIIFDEL